MGKGVTITELAAVVAVATGHGGVIVEILL